MNWSWRPGEELVLSLAVVAVLVLETDCHSIQPSGMVYTVFYICWAMSELPHPSWNHHFAAQRRVSESWLTEEESTAVVSLIRPRNWCRIIFYLADAWNLNKIWLFSDWFSNGAVTLSLLSTVKLSFDSPAYLCKRPHLWDVPDVRANRTIRVSPSLCQWTLIRNGNWLIDWNIRDCSTYIYLYP